MTNEFDEQERIEIRRAVEKNARKEEKRQHIQKLFEYLNGDMNEYTKIFKEVFPTRHRTLQQLFFIMLVNMCKEIRHNKFDARNRDVIEMAGLIADIAEREKLCSYAI